MTEIKYGNDDSRIPQENSLWRLFRVLVEEEQIPQEIKTSLDDKIEGW